MERIIWGNCSKCGIEIEDNNFGTIIGADEVAVCNNCKRDLDRKIIGELSRFRNSSDFERIIPLRKKILWASESLGNIFDAGDKSYIENVYDYNNYNVSQLQVFLLDILQSLLEEYIYTGGIESDYEECIRKNKDLEKLRLKVRRQQSLISSRLRWWEKE